MKYSNEKILKIQENAKKDKKKLTHITDKSKLSTEDIVKLGLCKHFVQFALNKKMRITQVAELIKVPKTRMSEITNYKINKFSIDQLLKNLSALAEHDAEIKEYLVFFGRAAEMPTISVTKTRKLTRELQEAAAQI